KYATYSFVSGMSPGYSGNLGFPLPTNWAFDQIKEYTIGSGNGSIGIDKNIKSGRDKGVSKIEKDSNKLSLTLQLLEMAGSTYNEKREIGSTNSAGWTLYQKSTNVRTDFDVYVYRKLVIKGAKDVENKYDYTVAFRGSQQWKDWVVDFLQVGQNYANLQAEDAAAYVGQLIRTDYQNMKKLYITGHSLGGFLAQWAQSEIIDGAIPSAESLAVTFSAPGFMPSLVPDNTFKIKVLNKLKNEHDGGGKYNSRIINHRIQQDIVAKFGDDLGTVHTYNGYNQVIESANNPLLKAQYYHSPDRYEERELN
ncbi:TPA: DUF2974 domain-containing protein, partial [Bacillus toyonensis]|nr:DUF2974 domain-containing protein [Bacillus toyonensis]